MQRAMEIQEAEVQRCIRSERGVFLNFVAGERVRRANLEGSLLIAKDLTDNFGDSLISPASTSATVCQGKKKKKKKRKKKESS